MSQATEVLSRAQTVRLARYALRREIKAGDTTVAAVLREPIHPDIEGWAIFELIRSAPRFGRHRTVNLLWRHRIGELRKLGELTERQKLALADDLEGR